LALHKNLMRSIIARNGHLQVVGDETTEELREALYNLRKHTYAKCHHPYTGTPIESLLPDISVLAVRSTRSKSARTVVDIDVANL